MSRQHDTESKSQVDPSLLAASGDAASEFPIDPALYAIEEVVDDVRKGKIRLQEQSVQEEGGEPVKQDGVHGVPSLAMGASGDHHGTGQGMQIEDDGIDPALREIVNSLTNAQQVCSIIAFIQHTLTSCRVVLSRHQSRPHSRSSGSCHRRAPHRHGRTRTTPAKSAVNP